MFSRYDCMTCTAQQQIQRGCEQDSFIPYWTDLEGQKQARCPRRPMLENPSWWPQLALVYNQYKAGFLPHGGGVFSQNCVFPELMYWMGMFLDRYQERMAHNPETPTEDDKPKNAAWKFNDGP